MKVKIYTTIIFLSLVWVSFINDPSYFSGIIIYDHTFETTDPKIDIEEIKNSFGLASEFYFKNGDYKQLFFETNNPRTTIYLNKENRIYNEVGSLDTLFYIDCSRANEIIEKVDIKEKSDTILSKICSKLSITTTDLKGHPYREAEYYFEESTKIDPIWFSNHKYGSYDKIYSIMKALPIKIVNRRESLTVIMTARTVARPGLGEHFFDLPEMPTREQK